MNERKGLGERIRQLREARGVTRAQLAKKIGTSRVTVFRLESGEQRLTESWLDRIAGGLEAPLTDIVFTAASGRIATKYEADARRWVTETELPIDAQFSIELPGERVTEDSFAVHVTGPGQAQRLPLASIVVCRPMAHDEHFEQGHLYFVRESKDGEYRFSFKELKQDARGRMWLEPPDPDPQFSAIPMNPTIVILGIVEGAYVTFNQPSTDK